MCMCVCVCVHKYWKERVNRRGSNKIGNKLDTDWSRNERQTITQHTAKAKIKKKKNENCSKRYPVKKCGNCALLHPLVTLSLSLSLVSNSECVMSYGAQKHTKYTPCKETKVTHTRHKRKTTRDGHNESAIVRYSQPQLLSQLLTKPTCLKLYDGYIAIAVRHSFIEFEKLIPICDLFFGLAVRTRACVRSAYFQ